MENCRSLPPLDEGKVKITLRRLAAEHGVSDLRFASPGRIIGHLADDRDLADMALFQRDIEDALGAHADFLTDRLLGKPGISDDLLTARPL